ncbi:MAG: hypothetical protein HY372_04000 [Candidatus Andersenbacteria bacterium]|nr:hypothetical protein [Candidatus Andersenbacteria bacterium]
MRRKIVIGLLASAVGAAAAVSFVPVREAGERFEQYTANTGELTDEAVVGQTLRASRNGLSGIAVKFATYSGRENTKPVLFSLRKSVDEIADVRTAAVPAARLGDNQFHMFRFAPIADSAGQTFFFIIVSPDSRTGDAVTIDIDGRDPYPRGTAYLARGSKTAAQDPAALHRAGKPAVDVSFSAYYSVPLGAAATHQVQAVARAWLQMWQEPPEQYVAAAKTGLIALLFVALIVYAAAGKKVNVRWILPALFLLAFIVRVMYARELPATYDEGNYLYDARTLWEGSLAGGDGYVKAPLVIAWLAAWQVLGNTLFIGRLSSITIGALTVLVVFALGRELGLTDREGTRTGLIAAAVYALAGATTVFNIYAHTQPLAIFLGGLGIAVLLPAIRSHASWPQFFLGGVILGLGVISRKSVLALGLIPLVFIGIDQVSWRLKLRQLIVIGGGFAAMAVVFLLLAGMIYGPEGFWEALGVNSAEDGLTMLDPTERENARAYSIRGMTPFFREALPLILLAALGLGVLLEQAVRGILPDALIKLVWFAPAAVFAWAWQFFLEHEGGAVMVFGMRGLWYAMAAVLLGAALLKNTAAARTAPRRAVLSAALLGPLWLGGLVIFYMNWIKFHANYIGEFLLPLAVLAGIGVLGVRDRLRLLPARALRVAGRLACMAVLSWAAGASGYATFVFEHTGTYTLKALTEAAAWARQNIPRDEPIFTGAALVPYLSGHRVALDIAHPRWYAYEFTRKDPQRLNTFLPSAEQMLAAFHDADWFLEDDQTSFSFFMEYDDLQAEFKSDFERAHGISNGSNTLTFYRRVR